MLGSTFDLAERLLAQSLPARWLHVNSVRRQALALGRAIPDVDSQVLHDSAVLHDIGYSDQVAQSGFHPTDGAMYLFRLGFQRRIVDLVAHHSCAAVEAKLRGIDSMVLYSDEVSATRDALWYCDATSGPSGERVSPGERWEEIRKRYGSDHLVSRFLDEAEPELRAAIRRTEDRLSAAALDQSM